MKFRDVVLLLVGGGLVVVGMLVGDLFENDAHADSHEYKVVEINYNGTGDWDYQYRIIYQGDVKEVELGRKDRGKILSVFLSGLIKTPEANQPLGYKLLGFCYS